jgi:hypothetical protein
MPIRYIIDVHNVLDVNVLVQGVPYIRLDLLLDQGDLLLGLLIVVFLYLPGVL